MDDESLVASFKVSVLQGIISVFAKGLDSPFNDWSDDAYRQGFSWRAESVSFRVFNNCDVSTSDVDIFLARHIRLRPDAKRAIAVPFDVPDSSAIQVSGICEKTDNCVYLSPGRYRLLFQIGYPSTWGREVRPKVECQRCWCALHFIHGNSSMPEILRLDEELDPPDPLVMDGIPA